MLHVCYKLQNHEICFICYARNRQCLCKLDDVIFRNAMNNYYGMIHMSVENTLGMEIIWRIILRVNLDDLESATIILIEDQDTRYPSLLALSLAIDEVLYFIGRNSTKLWNTRQSHWLFAV